MGIVRWKCPHCRSTLVQYLFGPTNDVIVYKKGGDDPFTAVVEMHRLLMKERPRVLSDENLISFPPGHKLTKVFDRNTV